MLIALKEATKQEKLAQIRTFLESNGHKVYTDYKRQYPLLYLHDAVLSTAEEEYLLQTPELHELSRNKCPYPFASRMFHPQQSKFKIGDKQFGTAQLLLFAGPCSVESRQQFLEIAIAMKEAGVTALRGGAFKPRTSPYYFQGHAEKALEWMLEAKEQTGLPLISEIMDADHLSIMSEVIDVFQVGSRNMQNFALLKKLGAAQKPVLLKRGMANTIEELLLAAEYILAHGNPNVMLCERGIRSFDKETRNAFDLNAIPVLQQKTHLPIVADPSHATGKWEYIEAVASGAIAAGADALIIEVHPDPKNALSDGRQSLKPERFFKLIQRLRRIARAIDRDL